MSTSDRRSPLASVTSVWSTLDAKRRAVVGLATLAVFAAVIGLTRGPGTGDMSLLYSGLESSAAGDVVTALEQRGIAYDVRGSAIYVPQAARDSLRMTLAAEGLPASGGQGYELLDQLSGFGTTSQMFDAAYWRAKEGELARTILATPGIRAARVHISTPNRQLFARGDRPTAAVTVSTSGGGLGTAQAEALRFLVAAAVSGLSPADVAVIDGEGGLVARDGPDQLHGGGDRAEARRARAQRLLEARVGYGNAVVELSVDTVTESEQIVERRIDPESRVAISTETEERSDSGKNTGTGAVTVASNLPDGDAEGGGGGSSSEASESRALTNYEISETSREVVRAPGAIRRLTVAVLVNSATETAADGSTSAVPRDDEELAALSALVASAVGFDASRGDEITIRSMAFEPVAQSGTEALPAAPSLPLDMMSLIQMGVLAAVALVLGLFVVRPILTSARPAPQLPPPAALGTPPPELLPAAASPAGAHAPSPGATARLSAPGDAGDETDPVDRLRRLIEERQDETIQILQSWVEDPDDTERA